jgi:hypothetical protein
MSETGKFTIKKKPYEMARCEYSNFFKDNQFKEGFEKF